MDESGGGSGRHPGDAMSQALGQLSRSARTIAQMRTYLRRKTHPDSEIERVISRLLEMGYLNDRDYAERYIASCRSRPRGRIRIVADLVARGVPKEVIDRVMESSFDPGEEAEALDRALAKAVSRPGGGLDAAGRRRVASRLLRKGFAPGQVRRAIAGIGSGSPPDAADREDGFEGDEE